MLIEASGALRSGYEPCIFFQNHLSNRSDRSPCCVVGLAWIGGDVWGGGRDRVPVDAQARTDLGALPGLPGGSRDAHGGTGRVERVLCGGPDPVCVRFVGAGDDGDDARHRIQDQHDCSVPAGVGVVCDACVVELPSVFVYA